MHANQLSKPTNMDRLAKVESAIDRFDSELHDIKASQRRTEDAVSRFIETVRNEQARSTRTNWPVLISAAGLILAITTSLGAALWLPQSAVLTRHESRLAESLEREIELRERVARLEALREAEAGQTKPAR